MSIVGVVIGLCILGFGIWTAQNHEGSVSSVVDVQVDTSPTPTTTETPTVTEEPTNTPTMTKTNTPTKVPTNTPAPNTNNSNSTSTFSVSGFHYPGASVTSSTNTPLELTTHDSPASVTDWYKNKINATGMNVKSFVTTTANEKVVNKLVAANGGQEISVDITKDPGSTTVKIIVEIK
jgi:hypothetical protein